MFLLSAVQAEEAPWPNLTPDTVPLSTITTIYNIKKKNSVEEISPAGSSSMYRTTHCDILAWMKMEP